MTDLPIVFRPANVNDVPFLFKTWLIDYHKVHPFNFIPTDIYKPVQTNIIQQLIQKTPVIICCLDDDPNQIVGYLVAQPYGESSILIHWAHIKAIYRRMGILKEMLAQLNYQDKNLICTHYFSLFKKLKDKYHIVYDPTILQDIINAT